MLQALLFFYSVHIGPLRNPRYERTTVGTRKKSALHEFLWDSYLKLSLIFNWNAPSDPRCEDFFAGIVLAAIERASLG